MEIFSHEEIKTAKNKLLNSNFTILPDPSTFPSKSSQSDKQDYQDLLKAYSLLYHKHQRELRQVELPRTQLTAPGCNEQLQVIAVNEQLEELRRELSTYQKFTNTFLESGAFFDDDILQSFYFRYNKKTLKAVITQGREFIIKKRRYASVWDFIESQHQ